MTNQGTFGLFKSTLMTYLLSWLIFLTLCVHKPFLKALIVIELISVWELSPQSWLHICPEYDIETFYTQRHADTFSSFFTKYVVLKDLHSGLCRIFLKRNKKNAAYHKIIRVRVFNTLVLALAYVLFHLLTISTRSSVVKTFIWLALRIKTSYSAAG